VAWGVEVIGRKHSVRPIETSYDGIRFRSRLEARRAVAFNALGLDYEYEKDSFRLPDGSCYLPDFYIHGLGWFEVKGKEPTDHEIYKICQLADITDRCAYLLHGNIPWPKNGQMPGYCDTAIGYTDRPLYLKSNAAFVACSHGFLFAPVQNGVYDSENGDERIRAEGKALFPHMCFCVNRSDHPRLLRAFGLARSARFWT